VTGQPCRNPHCDRACESWRKTYRGNLGYCARCWKRWMDHGYPAAGPPAPCYRHGSPGPAAGRIEDYQWLKRQGLSAAEAAVRLGLTRRTLLRYNARLRGSTEAADSERWRSVS